MIKQTIKLLALSVLLLALPAAVQAQLTFITNANNTITITGYTGSGGTVIIPNTTNGYPIASIGNRAFSGGTSLTNVVIGSGISSIEDGAFQSCYNLTNVTIPNSITNIGPYVFIDCHSLQNITIPNSVISIGEEAFSACYANTNVTIGSGVTSIGNRAFFDCSGLISITVASSNSMYSSVSGVLFNKSQTSLIKYPESKPGNYTISNSVTCIGKDAFAENRGLQGITIPNSVTNIGDYAFYQCYSLTNIAIPSSVISVGYWAFVDCQNLISINVATSNSMYGSVSGVFFDKSLTTLIQFPGGKGGNYIIPNSITNIGDSAFYDCASLTGVTIPNGVTTIGGSVFFNCTSLTSVIIPSSITSIGEWAFAYCNGLTGIYFEGNAPSLGGSYVFYNDYATVYIVFGTSGWPTAPAPFGAYFGGRPTAYWTPPSPPDLGISTYSSQPTVFFPTATGTNYVLQMTTNLASGNWVTVSNGIPISGLIITNPLSNAFFRLH